MDKKSWVTIVSIILAVVLAGTALWFAVSYDSGVAEAMETVGTQIAELNQTLVDYYTEQLEQLQQQYSVSLNQSNETLTQLNFQYELLLGNYSSLVEDYSGMMELQQQLTAEVNALMETIEKELNVTIPTWQHVAYFGVSQTTPSPQFYVNTTNWRINWSRGDFPATFIISNENNITISVQTQSKHGTYYPKNMTQGTYTITTPYLDSIRWVYFTIEQFV